MKPRTNRVAIYHIKDDLYEYNIYFLNQLLPYIDDLYIVVSENIDKKDLKFLKTIGHIVIFNASNALSAYKYVLINKKNNIEKYKQIILCDSYIFGPLQPLEKFFGDINNCKADIYTLESRMNNLISSSFLVLKNINQIDFLTTIQSSQYWIEVNSLTLTSFTHFVEQDNFYFLEIPENIIQKKQPFLQMGFFIQSPENWLAHSSGMQIKNVLDFIKMNTSYNEKMILDYLVKKQPMSVLRENLHLNYILPSDFSYSQNSEASVALIMYIYYEDLIDYCYKYALSMPDNADIYIITCKENMTQACKKAFKNFPCQHIYFRQMENRGRDVAAYLVVAKDVFEKYDYVCCMHDKKSPQYAKILGEDFAYHLFECNLSSKQYVENIIKTFDDNPYIGMLVPPCVNFGKINTVGNSIATEAQDVKQQLKILSLDVPFDNDVVAPLGTMFWVRGEAFLPIFNHNWIHEDFPYEPNKSTGTILHVLERTYPFAVQEAGYYVGFVAPLGYFQIYADTSYWLYMERQQQFYGLNGKKWARAEIKTIVATTATNSVLHFRDVKRAIKEYIKQKRQRKKQKKNSNKSSCIGNITLRYASVNNGRVILHILCKTDNIYAQCGIYKYYPKREVSFSIKQLYEYYKNYKTKAVLIELPLEKIKNQPIEIKMSEKEYFSAVWTGCISYGAFDFKKIGFFIRLHEGKIYIEDKFHFYKNVLFNFQYRIKEKLLFLLLKLNPIHKYILFADNEKVEDNSFELFKYAVARNQNCYYLASKSVISGVHDPLLKKHMVKFNSHRHIWMFFCSHKWISSYSLRCELFPQKGLIKDILLYNIPAKWIFVPHGITADKVSIMVHKYSFDEPSFTYCSSEHEKEYFSKKYEMRNVLALGYPRMDKWYDAKLDDKKIVLFFTWRIGLSLMQKGNLFQTPYVKYIIYLVKFIQTKFPQKHIYYVFHHEVVKAGLDEIIKKELGDKNISYIYLNTTESIQEFNHQFKTAKYLITDYSSVAYDFAYKKGSIPIYYLNEDFISGHYPLEQKFYDIHLGVLTKTLPELEKALKLNAPTAEMKKRKNKFFKYQDNKNCERVYNAIFLEEK